MVGYLSVVVVVVNTFEICEHFYQFYKFSKARQMLEMPNYNKYILHKEPAAKTALTVNHLVTLWKRECSNSAI